jgi:hypothetical protein
LSSDDHMIKESAEWAKLAISRAISVWGYCYLACSFLLEVPACIWVYWVGVRGCICVGSSVVCYFQTMEVTGLQVVPNCCISTTSLGSRFCHGGEWGGIAFKMWVKVCQKSLINYWV